MTSCSACLRVVFAITEMTWALSITLLCLATATAGYVLPNPTGKYNVTLSAGSLIDYTRNDRYASTPMPRALMLSVFQPATCESTVDIPYMPNKTAAYQGEALQSTFNITEDFSPLFEEALLPVCEVQSDGCSTHDDAPILLFSPGYSIPRLYYSVLASAIASEGFTVITIDHPHDANIITYPDGHAVYNNASILERPAWDEYPRARDASFVIDQLSNATAIAQLLPQRGPRPFPTDRIAMFGHSVGGASSIVAAAWDSRIRAAVNWDGTIFGSPRLSGLAQPVLFMTHDNTTGPSWLKAWPQLEGLKMVVRVANTTHQSFSDMPTLVQAAGQDLTRFADLLGTVEPSEMVQILTAYTTNWMQGAFTSKEGGVEEIWLDEFPKVTVLLKDNF